MPRDPLNLSMAAVGRAIRVAAVCLPACGNAWDARFFRFFGHDRGPLVIAALRLQHLVEILTLPSLNKAGTLTYTQYEH